MIMIPRYLVIVDGEYFANYDTAVEASVAVAKRIIDDGFSTYQIIDQLTKEVVERNNTVET